MLGRQLRKWLPRWEQGDIEGSQPEAGQLAVKMVLVASSSVGEEMVSFSSLAMVALGRRENGREGRKAEPVRRLAIHGA